MLQLSFDVYGLRSTVSRGNSLGWRLSLVLLVGLSIQTAFGQSGPTLTGTGYAFRSLTVAPGQVVGLQFADLRTILPPVNGPRRLRATSVPWPTSLGGISLNLTQYIRYSLGDTPIPFGPTKLPILQIDQQVSCFRASTPDCYVTIVTVQMPYGLNYYGSIYVASTEIVLSENGVDSQAFNVFVAGDQIHLVTGLDNGFVLNGFLAGPLVTPLMVPS